MSAVQEPELDRMTNTALNGAQHLNWSDIPVEHPAEGIERQMFVGEQMMICRFRFAPFLVTPEHAHPHEQMSLVVSGCAWRRPATSCTFPPTVFTALR